MHTHSIPLISTPSLSIGRTISRLRRQAKRLHVRIANVILRRSDYHSVNVHYEKIYACDLDDYQPTSRDLLCLKVLGYANKRPELRKVGEHMATRGQLEPQMEKRAC
jgi:hypothetical protein